MGGTGQNSFAAIPKSLHLHLRRHVAAGRENEPARGYRTKITNGLYSARDGPLFVADLSNSASHLCPPLVMSKGGRVGREQPGPQAGLCAYRRRYGVDVDAVVRELDRHDLGQQLEPSLGGTMGRAPDASLSVRVRRGPAAGGECRRPPWRAPDPHGCAPPPARRSIARSDRRRPPRADRHPGRTVYDNAAPFVEERDGASDGRLRRWAIPTLGDERQLVERDLGKAAGAGRQSGSPGYPLTGVICAWGLCPAWGSNLSLEGRNVRAVHHSAAEHQAPADETF